VSQIFISDLTYQSRGGAVKRLVPLLLLVAVLCRAATTSAQVTTTKLPVEAEYRLDALLSTVLVGVEAATFIYLVFERRYRLLMALGVLFMVISIGVMTYRSVIPVEVVQEGNTTMYVFSENTAARVYTAPMVLGLAMIVYSGLHVLRRLMRLV
jgi:hypothetical protein